MILTQREARSLRGLISSKLATGGRASIDDCVLALVEREIADRNVVDGAGREELLGGGSDNEGFVGKTSMGIMQPDKNSESNSDLSDLVRGNLFCDADNEVDTLEVDYDVLVSYYNQIFVRKVAKKELHADTIESFEKRRRKTGEVIIDMCRASQLSPYIVAKRWIERLERDGTITYNAVNSFIEQIDTFPDSKLGKELMECICEDPVLSHTSNQIKDVIGKVYEDFLVQKLVDRKMVFETENDLRNKGHSKTPDIHFLIPMGIFRGKSAGNRAAYGSSPRSRNGFYSFGNGATPSSSAQLLAPSSFCPPSPGSPKNRQSAFIVNWIDSKALFADEDTFEDNCTQFEEYLSRYGRGLVIYWHGFTEGVKELASRRCGADMIMIVDSFPEEWFFPTRDIFGEAVPDYVNS